MILIDTSIWIDHFRNGNTELKRQLLDNKVMIHPFIIGELACGSIKNRTEILNLLNELPMAIIADNNEVLSLIESKKLFGKGIGYIDVHLIASALLSNAELLTMDKKLQGIFLSLTR